MDDFKAAMSFISYEIKNLIIEGEYVRYYFKLVESEEKDLPVRCYPTMNIENISDIDEISSHLINCESTSEYLKELGEKLRSLI